MGETSAHPAHLKREGDCQQGGQRVKTNSPIHMFVLQGTESGGSRNVHACTPKKDGGFNSGAGRQENKCTALVFLSCREWIGGGGHGAVHRGGPGVCTEGGRPTQVHAEGVTLTQSDT